MCLPSCCMPKSYLVSHVKFGHSAFASFIHKTSQIIGNFMISHGQLISLPPCVMPKLERSIGDCKSWAILQPTYSWICPGSSRQIDKLSSLDYFPCNHTYLYCFPNTFFSSVFSLKLSKVSWACPVL